MEKLSSSRAYCERVRQGKCYNLYLFLELSSSARITDSGFEE